MVGKRDIAVVRGHGNRLVHHTQATLFSTLFAYHLGGQLNGVQVLAVGNTHHRPQFVSVAKLRCHLGQAATPLAFRDVLAVHQHPAQQ